MGNRDVLKLPEFRKLFTAQAISDIGDGMTFMALLLLVNELTHSPAALAVLSIAVAVPSMVGGVIAGAYADRLDRRRIMIVSDTVRAGLVLVFVVAGTVERLPILYVVAFLQAAVGTLFSPSRGALIPKVVPREGLMAANALGQLSRMIGGLLGTGLTGVIFALSGAAWPVFVLDAATFAASVLIVLRVDPALGRVTEGIRPAPRARAFVPPRWRASGSSAARRRSWRRSSGWRSRCSAWAP
jgi:MFS family permease